MTRYEAINVIFQIINSGILHDEIEEELNGVVNCICENGFEQCPVECLQRCKLEKCQNAEI